MEAYKSLYENPKAVIAIVSDVHIDYNGSEIKRRIKMVRKAFTDVEANCNADALITVGDTTSRGVNKNWDGVKECFDGINPAKNIIFTLGNHDTWGDDKGYGGYEKAIERYYSYSKEICNLQIDKPYFSKDINGYKFIFLGNTESGADQDCAAFSQEEIDWLKAEISAENEQKPVFVFCHQSVNGTHGLPRTWSKKEDPTWPADKGGIGIDSDSVWEILKSHKNVYFFSGHLHMALCGEKMIKKEGYSTFENKEGVTLINVPSLTRENHHGETKKTGTGLMMEIYDNKVVLRPRRFTKGKMFEKITYQSGNFWYESNIR